MVTLQIERLEITGCKLINQYEIQQNQHLQIVNIKGLTLHVLMNVVDGASPTSLLTS